jgi:uncharacterized membrane protein YczE
LARFSSSSHYNVFLATLGTMCHLSLGVWANILSVFLFVFVCIYLFLYVYKFFLFFFYFVAMLLIGHKLRHNCGLALARFSSSSHYNVFLATLGTMCHLSLGVWANILSVFLFVFVCIYLFLYVYKFFFYFFLFCCYVVDWT